MSTMSHFLRCFDCHHETPEDSYYVSCPQCGGFIEVVLNKALSDRVIKPEQPSIFKYEDFLPIEYRDEFATYETITETPEFYDEALSEALDVKVIAKDETVLPTGTWKDKEGFISIHRLFINDVRDLFVFSSGNTGTAIARSASIIQGPRIHMVLPAASRKRLQNLQQFYDPDFLDIHFFEGSNDECIQEAGRLAREQGILAEGGFANYARREGIKLFALEHIFKEDAEPVDWYAQPIAGGIGVYSYYKACLETGTKCPRILGVQADICAPMVNAWLDGAAQLEPHYIPSEVIPSPYVRVLRTRDPGDAYRILKNIMDECDGGFTAVSGEQIAEALNLFYRSEYFLQKYHETGVLIGLEAATVLAGVKKAVTEGYIQKGSTVLLCVSGAAKQGDVDLEWIENL